MAHILTTAGATHIAELDAAGSWAAATRTNDFETLEVTRGNDAVSTSDTRATIATADYVPGSATEFATGYPTLGDTDSRNPGKGATTWTWRFDVRSGLTGFVASNLHITNAAVGASEPLLMHGLLDTPFEKLTPQRLTVFVNIDAGATAGAVPTVYSALDEPGAVPRVHTYTDRARALATWRPQGSSRELTYAVKGETVNVLALLVDGSGAILAPAQLQRVTRTVTRQSFDGRWSAAETKNLAGCPVLSSLVMSDARWPFQEGYNFLDSYKVPESADETAYQLDYEVRKIGGTMQRLRVLIRTGPEAPGVTL